MSSEKQQRSHAQHQPLPSIAVEDSFSDDGMDIDDDSDTDDGYDERSYARKQLFTTICKIVLGIAIGIGVSFLIGGSSTTSSSPGVILPQAAGGGATGTTTGNNNSSCTTTGISSSSNSVGSMWVVENVTQTSHPFLLMSEHTAKEKCVSQGSNRVWVTTGDDRNDNDKDTTKGKCLGRCGPGNHRGSDNSSQGFNEIGRVDGCGRHISGRHCCEKGPKEKSPDGVNSCICWASKLIPIEDKVSWD